MAKGRRRRKSRFWVKVGDVLGVLLDGAAAIVEALWR